MNKGKWHSQTRPGKGEYKLETRKQGCLDLFRVLISQDKLADFGLKIIFLEHKLH